MIMHEFVSGASDELSSSTSTAHRHNVRADKAEKYKV